MNKHLLIDKPTGLVLALVGSIPVASALHAGFEESRLISISSRHPFWSTANRTMMSNRLFTFTEPNTIEESHERFPDEAMMAKELAEARRPVLSRLLSMVASWNDRGNTLLFSGMETVIEIALRDCDREQGQYTRNIQDYAEMMGMQPDEAYEHLDRMAASIQQRKLRALGFMQKYTKMINQADVASIEKVNSMMYTEWKEFTKDDPFAAGTINEAGEFEDASVDRGLESELFGEMIEETGAMRCHRRYW